MTALAISAAIFYAYVTYCLFRFDLTKSISVTYYHHQPGDRWLFTAFMIAFPIPMAFAAGGWLFSLAMIFAWVTGIAANTRRDRRTKIWHLIGSFGMIISGAAGLWFHFGLLDLLISGVLGTAAVYIPQVRAHTWLIEVWWFVIISFGIYVNLL